MTLNNLSSTPLPVLPPRAAESHKGDYGRILLIGGSRGFAGAPALAGIAALRSGAGLVTLAIPRSIQSTVASFEPSLMTLGLGTPDGDFLHAELCEIVCLATENKTALAIGPGLGVQASTVELVHALYARIEQPLVVDADGLNALAQRIDCLNAPPGPRILTPHPGEFQRLAGETVVAEANQRAEQAARLCRRDTTGQTIVVLKGHQTIVTDGKQFAVNPSGNPGMATGGTGDCLTGVITSLLGQRLAPWDAARLGVYLHGLAGDLAATQYGQTSLIASDLLQSLPAAFRKHSHRG